MSSENGSAYGALSLPCPSSFPPTLAFAVVPFLAALILAKKGDEMLTNVYLKNSVSFFGLQEVKLVQRKGCFLIPYKAHLTGVGYSNYQIFTGIRVSIPSLMGETLL